MQLRELALATIATTIPTYELKPTNWYVCVIDFCEDLCEATAVEGSPQGSFGTRDSDEIISRVPIGGLQAPFWYIHRLGLGPSAVLAS